MPLNMIVAMGSNRAIGRSGDLIWHLSADLRHFKELTMGHPIVMGRKTWQSLPKGALPGRTNIVVSHNKEFDAPGATLCSSIEQAIQLALSLDSEPFIIGGGTIYESAYTKASRIYLTEIDAIFEDADTYFPVIEPTEWEVVETSEYAADPKSGLRYRFVTLNKR